MLSRAIALLALALAWGGSGYLVYRVGYSHSLALHGDWMLMRDEKRRCTAFNPNTHETVGVWGKPDEERCHMSDFIDSLRPY